MRLSPWLLGFGLVISNAAWSAPEPIPGLSRPVVDEAGFLPQADVNRIENVLYEMHQQDKAQMAVYIPKTLGEDTIESFSIRVAEAWKLGKKGTDKGLLLIVAPQERKMRLEVGYGLEGAIPDVVARRLLDQILRPALREGRPGDGIFGVAVAIADALEVKLSSVPQGDHPSADLRDVSPGRPSFGALWFLVPLLFVFSGGLIGSIAGLVIAGIIFLVTRQILFAFIAFFIVSSIFRPRRRRVFSPFGGWWGGGGGGWGGGSGGGFGGGGFSGGGGGFGGGGASSNW